MARVKQPLSPRFFNDKRLGHHYYFAMRGAFSLVELSIVLVILGLLTGGILAGQSLIRAAELRSAATEHTRYVTAVSSFRDKYFAIPGDMANATSFWGALDGNNGIGSDCRGESTAAATCNGNGDGILTSHAAGAATYEFWLFWKHLANAGLVEGSFTGNNAGQVGNAICVSTDTTVAGCNAPASRLGKGVWDTQYIGVISGHASLFDRDYANVLGLAAGPKGLGYTSSTALLKTQELWNIDQKIDDGKPGLGKLLAAPWGTCSNAGSGATTSADYSLALSSIACTAIFPNAF